MTQLRQETRSIEKDRPNGGRWVGLGPVRPSKHVTDLSGPAILDSPNQSVRAAFLPHPRTSWQDGRSQKDEVSELKKQKESLETTQAAGECQNRHESPTFLVRLQAAETTNRHVRIAYLF